MERGNLRAWQDTSETRIAHTTILLVGPDSAIQRTLEKALRELASSVVVARDFDEAGALAARRSRPPSIVMLPEIEIDPDEFESSLAALRIRTRSPELVPIAYGRAPHDERRQALREAGVDLALFGRFGRHALRFQVNRALSPTPRRAQRGVLRAPKEWRARSFVSGKEKAVRCYSLSLGGAFFVTPRPWVVGSEIALELPVGGQRLLVGGRILYTNAEGPSERSGLPRGMAVAFGPLSERVRKAIQADVTRTQAGLQV